MSERLAVYTTVYHGVEPFLREWHDSVLAQSDRDFDLWIGADRISKTAVARAIGRDPRACWVASGEDDTPATLRQRAFTILAANYDSVVLVDSDDVLLPSRVLQARAWLAEADVAACALEMIDQDGAPLGVTFAPPGAVGWDDLLPRSNVFGLSNSAYRCAVLRQCLPLPSSCSLIDWLLVTRAWERGARLAFDPATHMLYRQHPANVARVLPPFTGDAILEGTRRVLTHYRFALDSAMPRPSRFRERIAAAADRVTRFHSGIAGSRQVLDRYRRAVSDMQPERLWWWWIARPELEYIWNT